MARRARLLLDLTPLDTPSGPRGIGRYIRELAAGLAELPEEELDGIELFGLTRLGWGGDCEVVDDLRAHVTKPRLPSSERDFYRWAYRQRVALFRAARRVGADAVHLPDPHATPLLLGAAGCRKIVTCHDLVPSRFPDHYFGAKDGGAWLGRRIERRRYRTADLVVAISEATRGDVIALLGLAPERVVRVYNGLDLTRWSAPQSAAGAEVLRRLGLEEGRFALYVGGFDWRKNVEGMLGGILRARELGSDLTLAWAGHLAPAHRAAVHAAAARLGAGAAALKELGYVDDAALAALYRGALCHLLVSRCEGFGLTVVEAMAAGCPVVTTHGGALGEVAGDAALKVDPEDVAEIGGALHRLSVDPVLRGDLVRRGAARALRFSRRAQAMEMAAVYRRLLARP